MIRGQAFDTFKLMIAAVIAIAILGILMGILSQLSLPTGNPESVLQSMLSNCGNSPGSVKTSDIVNFKGKQYDEIHFQQALESASVATITLTCDSTSFPLIECKAIDSAGAEIDSTTASSQPFVRFKGDGSFKARFKVNCESQPTVTMTLP